MKKILFLCVFMGFVQLQIVQIKAQAVMETGGKTMPDEWIDKDTGHKVIKLTRRDGVNMSFYFHNNPFIGNKMVFCGGNREKKAAGIPGEEIYSADVNNLQMYWVDLTSMKVEQLTRETRSVRSEIVCARTKEVFYQLGDSVFSLNVESKKKRLVYVFPTNEHSSIVTVNADGSLLAGVFSNPKEAEIVKQYPLKSQFFNRIYESKLPRTIFVGKVDLKTLQEKDYELERNEWSVHYTTSWGENLMAGDGGDSTSVAKAPNGKWIYLFTPSGNRLQSTKLVNMKNHHYHLEPNVHFSPDNKWVIFRANFEGKENVYAVQINK